MTTLSMSDACFCWRPSPGYAWHIAILTKASGQRFLALCKHQTTERAGARCAGGSGHMKGKPLPCAQEGLKPEPPPLSEAEAGLRNEKIAVDDFGDKVAHASRKVCMRMWAPAHCSLAAVLLQPSG